ncbi:citron rho-interacting kinase-like [Aricia agestis]|uniref:citron rho-interacting kinase-like n=1 Tax=Aricia agestis TaxID=91739 RepID=UPI001C2069F5|nr:citron rho-interacting kinase-like [Aricia agestis]
MEPSKEAIAIRVMRLNRQITGKVLKNSNKLSKKIDRETLLDALTVLYDECNEDPVKKCDEHVRIFLDKYRSALAELRQARVCLSDFQLVQLIGKGAYGEVHMVREKQTGDVYALKGIKKEQARKRVCGAEDERDILASTSTHWIPRLQYAFQDNIHLYLVMELCNGGDLASLLGRRNNPLSEKDAAFYIAEVAHALKALHAMGYVHRDVKPENILLDRCGHIKLGDFGSCARMSEGACIGLGVGGTPDYVAPELLTDDCGSTHAGCRDFCRRAATAISACDYWSLGVVAFELVTLNRPFSTEDDDSTAKILSEIQKYERDEDAEPPFDPLPHGPSHTWRSLVRGLLRVHPARRYNYLDTLQHPALAHLALHNIRDQAPPWVPLLRGAEDASYLPAPHRDMAPPSAAPFRTRPPFAGQLPFVGYSYVAPEEHEDSTAGFNASHDCTAIDLATFKSAEKLAAMRSKEIASLQSQLAAAEAAASGAADAARRDADADAERMRARLQADITALSLQNKRLERQVEVEKEERMALQRTNQELSAGLAERSSAELRVAQAEANELRAERDVMRADMSRLEARISELQAECAAALAAADSARVQHKQYKDMFQHVQELRHRWFTELNIKPLDTVAKERAARRQTLIGGEADAARLVAAEASAARELRARNDLERRLAAAEAELALAEQRHTAGQAELTQANERLENAERMLTEKERTTNTLNRHLEELQVQLSQERLRNTALAAQVQELERGVGAAAERETALEEQSARTEARLQQRLADAEQRAAAALADDARRQQKVGTLEQLVRQLEREVSALEQRSCPKCAGAVAGPVQTSATNTDDDDARDCRSDTESVADPQLAAHVALLREQLERAEAQLQTRADEIATLRQEARSANLARWRKEKEFNELSLDAKVTARDLKRSEERIASAVEARRAAEEKLMVLHKEVTTLRPQCEQYKKDVERLTGQVDKLQKSNDVLQAEVDRSRNDIRKLKSEVQYSEKRRLHAEEQEELSARERAQLRDELMPLRAQNTDLMQNNRALQEACGLLEEQLTDLEKLTDIHETKNKELESELISLRSEMETCRKQLLESERRCGELAAEAAAADKRARDANDMLQRANLQLDILREKLESRECLVSELESRTAELESEAAGRDAALTAAARRVRELQEEAATLRTRAQHHHTAALQLQASLADAQEEAAAAREANDAATAWWRTRETKADATLRQQAKLIDFLQAKVEEAGRKKGSLSTKLFGRSGRRGAASPPLLRVNRELREEIERLRTRLAAATANGEANVPPTPRREKKLDKPKKIIINGSPRFDPEEIDDDSLLIVWKDGSRERWEARADGTGAVLRRGATEIRARLAGPDVPHLPHNEASRAFQLKLEDSARGDSAAAVCCSVERRAAWLAQLTAPAPRAPPPGTAELTRIPATPAAALYIANNAVAIGWGGGLSSTRGAVQLQWADEDAVGAVTALCGAGGRALVLAGGRLGHAPLLALASALRRASSLEPALTLQPLELPDHTVPHLVKGAMDGDGSAAVACGRRVMLLRYAAARGEFVCQRAVTVDAPARALLPTAAALYVAGEKPLRLALPAGAIETFALDDTTVAAAYKRRSPPRALLQVRKRPVEILICYDECGVFVDETGKRTRTEDPKWGSSVNAWEYVAPFLYLVSSNKISVVHLSDEAYRAPPCTCDATSLASSASEGSLPEIFNVKIDEPRLLGTTPDGIIVSTEVDGDHVVLAVDGRAAFRSVGASLESLTTESGSARESRGSCSDLAQSSTDLSPHDESRESVEITTGFLADIRKRAHQLREKQREERRQDEVIKKILTTEVGLKRPSLGRKSPVDTSEFDSDSTPESDDGTGSTKRTADVCAEMFTRQVRFDRN